MDLGTSVTPLALLGVLAACGGSSRDASSSLERAIDVALTQRLGIAVRTHCLGYLPRCAAVLPDGDTLPIAVTTTTGSTTWHVDGLLVTTDQLEAYLRDELADLGAPQTARCAPRIRLLAANARIECRLQHGGAGFVTVHADGTFALELVLDPAAATARSEPITPARDQELTTTSHALAAGDEVGEGDGQPPADAPTDAPAAAPDPR